ncbi:MAG: hypothetical protein S4CHLAM6_01430 [Chlamydiae bacterium]|nr:hypothetical protein [Chlamydiota bacterium]
MNALVDFFLPPINFVDCKEFISGLDSRSFGPQGDILSNALAEVSSSNPELSRLLVKFRSLIASSFEDKLVQNYSVQRQSGQSTDSLGRKSHSFLGEYFFEVIAANDDLKKLSLEVSSQCIESSYIQKITSCLKSWLTGAIFYSPLELQVSAKSSLESNNFDVVLSCDNSLYNDKLFCRQATNALLLT